MQNGYMGPKGPILAAKRLHIPVDGRGKHVLRAKEANRPLDQGLGTGYGPSRAPSQAWRPVQASLPFGTGLFPVNRPCRALFPVNRACKALFPINRACKALFPVNRACRAL